MASMHMDVDAVRSVSDGMNKASDEMRQLIQNMSSAVDGLRGQLWMGNAAAQFYQNYDDWRSRVSSELNDLAELAAQLHREIQEWEATDSRLG